VKLFVHPEAAAEMNEAAAFYGREANVELALAFIAEVDRAFSLLEKNPEIGPLWRGDARRLPLRRFPYNVVYRRQATRLEILAIAHQRRRPGYWKMRQ
jgi:plasmid stabilization system protein ParE